MSGNSVPGDGNIDGNDRAHSPKADTALQGKLDRRLHQTSGWVMTPPQIRRRYLISGRVQGVGFRWFTRGTADRLNLVGWVKNLPDGSVLCEAQGSPDLLEDFLGQLREGPAFARVSDIEVEDLPVMRSPESSFDVRR